jgi:hypothetical protein
MPAEPSHTLKFADVLAHEHAQLRLRRELLGGEPPQAEDPSIGQPRIEQPRIGNPSHQQTQSVEWPRSAEQASNAEQADGHSNGPQSLAAHLGDPTEDAVGLALSGGGIRSAAFNLGVIQALAEQRLLSSIDYLSTVSGGGYIGSWLTAWIKRDGDVRNVERQLMTRRDAQAQAIRSNHLDQAAARRAHSPIVEQAQAGEPEPLRHIRANSNYLTPRPGLLTPDSWALIAIFLRNIFLNILVIFPSLLGLVTLALSIGATYVYVSRLDSSLWEPVLWWSIPVVALASGGLAAYRFAKDMKAARDFCEGRSLSGTPQVWPVYWHVLLAFTACAALALDLSRVESLLAGSVTASDLAQDTGRTNAPRFSLSGYFGWLGVIGIFGLLHASFNLQAIIGLLRLRNLRVNGIWILSGLVAGATQGALLLCLRWLAVHLEYFQFLWLTEVDAPIWRAILMTPLVVLAFFIGESLQVGILGNLEHRLIRERWSAFLSGCLMFSALWCVVFLHVFVISALLLINTQLLTDFVAFALWALAALSSLGIAKGPRTSNAEGKSSSWLDYIA